MHPEKPGLKILITSGATREPIDGVRFITNVSTGKTGARLADFFGEVGFGVTYLHGEGAALPGARARLVQFSDFTSLDRALERELSTEKYFVVVHLAAVSDYSVDRVIVGDCSFRPDEIQKLDSGEEPVLKLKRNHKIVQRLKSYAGAGTRIVAFKLTNASERRERVAAVEKLLWGGGVDVVVHNDLSEVRSGEREHRFEIFIPGSGNRAESWKECRGTDELGTALVEWSAK